MAVQSDTSRISYAGNNSTSTSYAVPFVFLENAHLKAIAKTSAGVETVVTLTNHTGAGNVNGGTVRTSVAIPTTSTLTIYRDVPITQTTTYAEGGDFPAASHERALDKLTQISQQNARKLGSALRLSEANQIGELNPPLTNQQHILSSVGGAAPSWQALPSLSIGPVIATGSTTPRSVQDRFADAINVKDFGATGDGVTDDRDAFVAAANAATAQSKRLIIPSGTYNISGGGLIPIGDVCIESYGTITGAGASFGAQNCPFGTGNFQFHKMGTYQNVLQFDRWNVNATDSEAHAGIAVLRRYDGRANTSSYHQSGTPISGYLHYGEERAALAQKASGTANAVAGHINVFSLDNGTGGGRSEIVPVAGAVSCSPTASITAGGNYYNEFSINGPTGTSGSDPQREGFLAGGCFLVQKYCPSNTKDANHEGSYGITITTRCGSGGFDFSRPSNVETYKLFAGLAINGWSGVAGVATDGHSASANSAYEWGIIVGGHGSVWTAHDTNSKIDTGIGIRDYVFWGLQIFSRHPDNNADSGAIAVHAGAGASLFGMSSASADTVSVIQAQSSGRFDSAIRVWPTTHVSSERAGLRLDDWTFIQDTSGTGTKDFSIYQAGTANATRAIISTSGNVSIGSVDPLSKLHVDGDITVSNATTATSAAAGTNGSTPAQVEGYLVVKINGTARRIPYYNAP